MADSREQTVTSGAQDDHYDFVIVGSGFGGSVSALRLAEKGYSVCVLEKGRRFKPEDFPKTNWNLRKWMWMPQLGWRGFFKMTFFRHVTVLSGVGVGGGSLVYANTLPVPKSDYFNAPSWAHLADWEAELAPHYRTAQRMLGASKNPLVTEPDRIIKQVAEEIGRIDHFDSNPVGVFFGEPGKTVPDPYFNGEGPERTGCIKCGACMTGCRHGAKNTLDRNYLYLAEKRGVQVVPETEVTAVRPRTEGGYAIEATTQRGWFRKKRRHFTATNVVFSGGVLGTTDLLLRMQADPLGLPRLSKQLGNHVRTNSETLLAALTPDKDVRYSDGIAITSILHTDEQSHIEPCRYGEGSGFFRMLVLPHAPGDMLSARLANMVRSVLKQPRKWLRAYAVRDLAKQSFVMLYMRTAEGTLKLRHSRKPWRFGRKSLSSQAGTGVPPRANIPEAVDLARRIEKYTGGVTVGLGTETLLGTPTTAHILGGCCMGQNAEEGVIDLKHRVFGYTGLYVIDGSAISANPGVNPSLTITALAERAMAHIPAKVLVHEREVVEYGAAPVRA